MSFNSLGLNSTPSIYSYLSNDSRPQNWQERDVRDPGTVYNKELTALQSPSLLFWKKIGEFREEEKGSVTRKSLAELGYIGCGVVSTIETAIKLPVCYLIGNPLAHYSAQAINIFAVILDPYKSVDYDVLAGKKGKVIQEYKKVKTICNRSLGLSFHGIIQSCASTITNLISQNANMKTAKTISNGLSDRPATVVNVIENISPVSIALTAITHNPKYILTSFQDEVLEAAGVENPFVYSPAKRLERAIKKLVL